MANAYFAQALTADGRVWQESRVSYRREEAMQWAEAHLKGGPEYRRSRVVLNGAVIWDSIGSEVKGNPNPTACKCSQTQCGFIHSEE